MREEISCGGYKSKEHAYLAPDMDFSIDVSRVSLYCAGPYVQHVGYVAIPQTLADQFCYFSLTRRKIVPALHVRPLLLVEQYYVRLFGAGAIACEIITL